MWSHNLLTAFTLSEDAHQSLPAVGEMVHMLKGWESATLLMYGDLCCVVQLLERKLLEESERPIEERQLFKLDAIGMWTKLRPGVRAMLAQLAPLFQMWIFTNGTRCVCMRIAIHQALTESLFQ